VKLSNAIPEGVRQAKRRRVYHGVGCGTMERSKTWTPPASPAAAERRELVSLLIPTCRSTHENTLNGARAALVLRLGARHRSHYVRGDHDLDRSRITSTATTAEDRRRDDAPRRSNATTQQRDCIVSAMQLRPQEMNRGHPFPKIAPHHVHRPMKSLDGGFEMYSANIVHFLPRGLCTHVGTWRMSTVNRSVAAERRQQSSSVSGGRRLSLPNTV